MSGPETEPADVLVRCREALKLLGANRVIHHGRPLSEHLIGTCRLLKEWGNPCDVCVAGAFHSIYGTEEFGTRAVPYSKRDFIRALVGTEAEQIAYLFSIANRREFYRLNDDGPFFIVAPSLPDEIAIGVGHYSALLDIEVANIVDQALHQAGVPISVVEYWVGAFDSKKRFLSDGAILSYGQVLRAYGLTTSNGVPVADPDEQT